MAAVTTAVNSSAATTPGIAGMSNLPVEISGTAERSM